MLRNALMFRIILACIACNILLYYLNIGGMLQLTLVSITTCAVTMWFAVIYVLCSNKITLTKGTPVLGVITHISKGFKIMGEREIILHVTVTDGSHVLTTHKINTMDADAGAYPINSYCVLYFYKNNITIGPSGEDVSKYFEDVDLELLEDLIVKANNTEV